MLKSIAIHGDIHVSPFGPLLVECDRRTGEVQAWNTETWRIVGRLVRGTTFADSWVAYKYHIIAFSPSGRTLVHSSSSDHLIVREISSDWLGPCYSADTLRDIGAFLEKAAASDDGSRVICFWLFPQNKGSQNSRETEFRVWDVVNGGCRSTKLCEPPLSEFALASAPDGRLFMDFRVTSGEMNSTSFMHEANVPLHGPLSICRFSTHYQSLG